MRHRLATHVMTVTPPSAVRESKPFPWAGLVVLAAAVFLSVTSEMIPTGLLPEMSSTLQVSQAQVGLLVTVFAFTVVITSTSLTALTRRFPRHILIMAVLVVLAISNVLTALSPDFGLVVLSRVVGGLAHGLFWSIVSAYAGHLVPKEQIGRAVSIVLGGGTLAFVFGVPLGTAGGHLFGWRLTFVLLAGLMLVGAVLVWRFLPVVPRIERPTRAQRRQGARPPRDRTIGAVAIVCIVTALIMIGHYTVYTYVAPFLIDRMDAGSAAVAPLLFVYGIAGAIGLVVAGSVFGPRPTLGLVTAIVITGISVTAMGLTTGILWLSIAAFFIWGLAFGMLPPLLQTRLLHTASARIRDTASAFYTTAFNVGIGGGALLGAVVFETAGLGYLPFVYVAILIVALVLLLAMRRRGRRRSRSQTATVSIQVAEPVPGL